MKLLVLALCLLCDQTFGQQLLRHSGNGQLYKIVGGRAYPVPANQVPPGLVPVVAHPGVPPNYGNREPLFGNGRFLSGIGALLNPQYASNPKEYQVSVAEAVPPQDPIVEAPLGGLFTRLFQNTQRLAKGLGRGLTNVGAKAAGKEIPGDTAIPPPGPFLEFLKPNGKPPGPLGEFKQKLTEARIKQQERAKAFQDQWNELISGKPAPKSIEKSTENAIAKAFAKLQETFSPKSKEPSSSALQQSRSAANPVFYEEEDFPSQQERQGPSLRSRLRSLERESQRQTPRNRPRSVEEVARPLFRRIRHRSGEREEPRPKIRTIIRDGERAVSVRGSPRLLGSRRRVQAAASRPKIVPTAAAAPPPPPPPPPPAAPPAEAWETGVNIPPPAARKVQEEVPAVQEYVEADSPAAAPVDEAALYEYNPDSPVIPPEVAEYLNLGDDYEPQERRVVNEDGTVDHYWVLEVDEEKKN